LGLRMRAISVLIALARTATPALTNVSKLALGETQHAVVQPDSFADFVVYAEDDRDSLTFQMSASHALALYVVDGGVGEGLPQELGGALLSSDEVTRALHNCLRNAGPCHHSERLHRELMSLTTPPPTTLLFRCHSPLHCRRLPSMLIRHRTSSMTQPARTACAATTVM